MSGPIATIPSAVTYTCTKIGCKANHPGRCMQQELANAASLLDCKVFHEDKTSKRTQVPKACSNCRKMHAGCDTKRPCTRCEQQSLASTCVDVPRKKREIRKKQKFEPGVSPVPSVTPISIPPNSNTEPPVIHPPVYQIESNGHSTWWETQILNDSVLESSDASPPFDCSSPLIQTELFSSPLSPSLFLSTSLMDRSPMANSQHNGFLSQDCGTQEHPFQVDGAFSLQANSHSSSISDVNQSFASSPSSQLSPSSQSSSPQLSPNPSATQFYLDKLKQGKDTVVRITRAPQKPLNYLQTQRPHPSQACTTQTFVHKTPQTSVQTSSPPPSMWFSHNGINGCQSIAMSLWKAGPSGNNVLMEWNEKFAQLLDYPLETLTNNFTCKKLVPKNHPMQAKTKKTPIATSTGTKEVEITVIPLTELKLFVLLMVE